MDRISIFLSYSSKQRKIAGDFKHYLVSYCGFEVFLAHEDIHMSIEWEEEIIRRLKVCDFFVPLISYEYKISDFCDQEIGIAVCLGKKIFPIKLEHINPYGFIKKYQAEQYKDDNLNDIANNFLKNRIKF